MCPPGTPTISMWSSSRAYSSSCSSRTRPNCSAWTSSAGNSASTVGGGGSRQISPYIARTPGAARKRSVHRFVVRREGVVLRRLLREVEPDVRQDLNRRIQQHRRRQLLRLPRRQLE